MSKFYPLRIALEKDGWQIEKIEPESNDWWSFQIWRLTSRWSPVGFQMRLSFVVDPQMDRLIEENVVNLNVSSKPLDYFWSHDAQDFFLTHWDKCLEQTLRCLSGHRDSALQATNELT